MNNSNTGVDLFDPIDFILLLVIEIPSILCTLLILIYLCQHWHDMVTKALRNHAILLLTILSFLYNTLDLPFTINSFRLGYDQPRTPSFCNWWYWIDDVITVSSLLLAATASIQRHVLIFNIHFLNRRRMRYLFHYCPLIICIVYPPIFYLILIYFYQCEYSSDEYDQYCPNPCYSNDVILFNIDWIINTLAPTFIIVITNLVLIYRVIQSLKRFHRRKSLLWKGQRKLTRELLLISSVYAIGWCPSTVVAVIEQFFLPNLVENIPALYYLYYLSYFVCPLQPFVCLAIVPEVILFVKNDIRKFLTRSLVEPILHVVRNHPG